MPGGIDRLFNNLWNEEKAVFNSRRRSLVFATVVFLRHHIWTQAEGDIIFKGRNRVCKRFNACCIGGTELFNQIQDPVQLSSNFLYLCVRDVKLCQLGDAVHIRKVKSHKSGTS